MTAEETSIFFLQPIQYFHIIYLNCIGKSTFHLTVPVFIYHSNFFQSIFRLWVPISRYYLMCFKSQIIWYLDCILLKINFFPIHSKNSDSHTLLVSHTIYFFFLVHIQEDSHLEHLASCIYVTVQFRLGPSTSLFPKSLSNEP